MCNQVLTSDLDSRHTAAEWLHHTLNELFPADDTDYEAENQLITSLITRYRQLLLAVDVTTSRSSVVIRCHDYKEAVERHVQWLTDTEDKVREDVPLDDLDSVRAMLDNQQVS